MLIFLRRNATGLLIGGAGGAVFAVLGLPLAWMLGAMGFTTVAAIRGAKIEVSKRLCNAALSVLGVTLGSAFSPALLGSIASWRWSIAGLLAYVAIATAIGWAFLRAMYRTDEVTAYFAAAPGGMTEMAVAGEELGARTDLIALSHTIRILLVAFTIPFGMTMLVGVPSTSLPRVSLDVPSHLFLQFLLVAGCLLGGPIAARLKLPAAWMVGPMLLSGFFHVTGWVQVTLPVIAIYTAQVVIGTSLGSRFTGMSLKTIRRNSLLTGGLTLILICISGIFAVGVHMASGLPTMDIFLAYSPGGFTEMSLVAMAVGCDVAFVSAHHIIRVFGIAVLAPLAFKALR